MSTWVMPFQLSTVVALAYYSQSNFEHDMVDCVQRTVFERYSTVTCN